MNDGVTNELTNALPNEVKVKKTRKTIQPLQVSRPVGRPSTYSTELRDEYCRRIATGMSLRTVCKADDMPAMNTIFQWMGSREDFKEHYARACEERTDAMAEDIIDIADSTTGDAVRDRLRVDTRKWIMAKMKPKKYGDKVDITSDGKALPAPIMNGLSVNMNKPDELPEPRKQVVSE